MKVYMLLLATASATATAKHQARKAAPISSAAVDLIGNLEGFSATYYTINGHETIGRFMKLETETGHKLNMTRIRP